MKRNIRNNSLEFFLVLSFLILSFSFPRVSNAQYQHKLFTSNLMIEGKVYYGFIYAHHLELEIFNSHVMAFEVSILQQTYGRHKWEIAFNYPIIGIGMWYSSLGKSPYLGSALALFPYINFPLFKNDKLMCNFRFALGIGYLTKKFDRLENYKNLAIGSHFNAALNVMLEARYRLSNMIILTGGIALQHFSNGSLKLPNYGLNIPMINAGIVYRLARKNKDIGDHFYPPVEPFSAIIRHSIEFDFGAAIGYKNLSAILGRNFLVYHFYENTLFPISRKSQVGFGFDLSYDGSHVAILDKAGESYSSMFQIMRPGINAAYNLNMGKLNFIVNLGYYLGGKVTNNGPLYEKFSLQYNFSKSFFANVMLKVHFGRADYIGWGLGYRFLYLYGKKPVKTRFTPPVRSMETD